MEAICMKCLIFFVWKKKKKKRKKKKKQEIYFKISSADFFPSMRIKKPPFVVKYPRFKHLGLIVQHWQWR